ncbi:MAG: hypothetical protein AB2L18_02540 [Anaerolineaceae bacterium]
MNEEAITILDYLPLRLDSDANQEYLLFLRDCFEVNYENKRYSFAFIAYHMMYMSTIYLFIWKIKKWKKIEFEHALIGFSNKEYKQIIEAKDLFIFHIIPERRIFNFLRLLDFDENEIGTFRKNVDYRNDIAHSNGVISFNDQNSIDKNIDEINNNLKVIQEKCANCLDNVLLNFFKNHWNVNKNQYDNFSDEINEIFIRENYLTQKDMLYITHFDINTIQNEDHFYEKKQLFEEILSLYSEEP